ncbi:MAG TPA: RNA methyltransferase [Phycisphaerales bacterium]|nr:RNA methyltransferase [Phycisphaerales bacterium]
MPRLVEIADPADARIADYRNLRDGFRAADDPAQRAPGRVFIAEGAVVVRALVRSSYQTRSLLCTPARLGALAAELALLPETTPVYVAPQAVLNQIAGFNIHRGLLAVGVRPGEPAAGDAVRAARTLVVLEDLANHDNIGGVFRDTAALGGPGAAVLLSPRCADPLYRKALRVSAGHVLGVPYARLSTWPGDLELVRRQGFVIVATTPSPDAPDICAAFRGGVPERLALLLGAEGPGLSAGALAEADLRVRIRISPQVDSLNVAVAAAVCLHGLGRLDAPGPATRNPGGGMSV